MIDPCCPPLRRVRRRHGIWRGHRHAAHHAAPCVRSCVAKALLFGALGAGAVGAGAAAGWTATALQQRPDFAAPARGAGDGAGVPFGGSAGAMWGAADENHAPDRHHGRPPPQPIPEPSGAWVLAAALAAVVVVRGRA